MPTPPTTDAQNLSLAWKNGTYPFSYSWPSSPLKVSLDIVHVKRFHIIFCLTRALLMGFKAENLVIAKGSINCYFCSLFFTPFLCHEFFSKKRGNGSNFMYWTWPRLASQRSNDINLISTEAFNYLTEDISLSLQRDYTGASSPYFRRGGIAVS